MQCKMQFFTFGLQRLNTRRVRMLCRVVVGTCYPEKYQCHAQPQINQPTNPGWTLHLLSLTHSLTHSLAHSLTYRYSLTYLLVNLIILRVVGDQHNVVNGVTVVLQKAARGADCGVGRFFSWVALLQLVPARTRHHALFIGIYHRRHVGVNTAKALNTTIIHHRKLRITDRQQTPHTRSDRSLPRGSGTHTFPH